MKKLMMALALCLMSAVVVNAENRQVSTNLPANTPTIDLTISGQTRTIRLTKAVVKEKDASHIACTVYAGQDKASVTLPISFDKALELAEKVVDLAHDANLISEELYEQCMREYQRLTDH